MKKQKLTPAMIVMLRSASAGLPLTAGLRGRSAHGGAEWTRMALIRRGLLDRNCSITADGYGELAEWSKAQPSNVQIKGSPAFGRSLLNDGFDPILRSKDHE